VTGGAGEGTAEPPLLQTRPYSPEEERVFSLSLFEAEELLARGAGAKALVIASRAVKERPDSLTARALMERARRELLRGRKREKLESRLREAEAALGAGDLKAAERVILSALKVVPDHDLAQELFRRLKEARISQGAIEVEAEEELQRLAQAEVKRAVEAARAAREAGWEAKALLSIRRGLRVVPDAPELLGLLSETQESVDAGESDRSRRHALAAQVRAGQELLRRGQIGESLKILRAVLAEDPHNARAQAAIQEVRQVWLARSGGPQKRAQAQPAAAEHPGPLRGVLDVPETVVLARPEAPPEPIEPRLPVRPRPSELRIPTEIRLPRTLQRATPLSLVLGCGALVALGVVVTLWRGSPSPPAPSPSETAPAVRLATGEGKSADPSLLADLEPTLRQTIEDTLSGFTRALETRDAALLARVRPDLTPQERQDLLAPFEGALDATVSLRVLDVATRGDEVEVDTLRRETIVRSNSAPRPPSEEILRFDRRKGVWVLRPSRDH
jgi:hypothetical protein